MVNLEGDNMARHIEKRGRKWYAVLTIPKQIRHHFGGRLRFFQALKTETETVAITRAAPLVAQWRSWIAKAQGIALDPFEADVQFFRQALAEARTLPSAEGPEDADPGGDAKLELIGLAQDMDDKHPGRGLAVWKRATGETTGTLDHLDAFLAVAADTDRGKAMKKADVVRLAEQFPTIDNITRPNVRRWCDGLIKDVGLKRTTVVRLLSSCRTYWRHLQVHGVVPDEIEPFDKLALPGAKNGSNKADEPVPYERQDVVRLLQAAEDKGDQQLIDVIRLAMFTGARIGEICALKIEAVNLTGQSFKIVDAKTRAGWREVPVHASLQSTMVRLVRDSADGYVLSGLTADKYGARNGGVGKRFGNMKRAMGFGETHVFHSIRKTVVTELLRADVTLETVQDIVGHERQGVTAKVYYGGATLEIKRDALAKLAYPSSP